MYISSAARPRDNGHANVQMTIEAIRTARTTLQLNKSRCVVVFDGLNSKPGVTQRMREHYASKIRRVREGVPPDVDVLVLEEWLHKANSLRCAMRTMPRTPLVYQMEDDTIVRGHFEAAAVYDALIAATTAAAAAPASSAIPSIVEYVRLNMQDDCLKPQMHARPECACCTKQPPAKQLPGNSCALIRKDKVPPNNRRPVCDSGFCYSDPLHVPCVPHQSSGGLGSASRRGTRLDTALRSLALPPSFYPPVSS